MYLEGCSLATAFCRLCFLVTTVITVRLGYCGCDCCPLTLQVSRFASVRLSRAFCTCGFLKPSQARKSATICVLKGLFLLTIKFAMCASACGGGETRKSQQLMV